MCFSAPVSFITSGALTLAGIGSAQKARGKERMIAAIPFLFAIQQFIEGAQWIMISQGKLSLTLGYLFLIFAFLIWPIYIPLAMYELEKNLKRKNVLKFFVLAGIIITSILGIILYLFPLTIEPLHLGINYAINVPFAYWGVIIYVAVTTGSVLLSTNKYYKIFGIIFILSAIIASYFYYVTFTSIWCFFAAALSILIYFYLRFIPRSRKV